MSKLNVRDLDVAAVSEEVVANYLIRHPDFFERHANVLTRLHVPHERGNQTVSLVERQVQALREKNERLEARLQEFVSIAEANDALTAKIDRLACRLIHARGAAQLIAALERSLLEDFGATHWLMLSLRTNVPELSRVTTRHLRLVERGAAELKPFDTFFESARPRCGQIRDTQRDYLFGNEAIEIGSAALVPLGPQASFGLLAVGSNDAEHFSPAMSTDFLTRLGELVSEAVRGLKAEG